MGKKKTQMDLCENPQKNKISDCSILIMFCNFLKYYSHFGLSEPVIVINQEWKFHCIL